MFIIGSRSSDVSSTSMRRSHLLWSAELIVERENKLFRCNTKTEVSQSSGCEAVQSMRFDVGKR